jgi:hypothetical protein
MISAFSASAVGVAAQPYVDAAAASAAQAEALTATDPLPQVDVLGIISRPDLSNNWNPAIADIGWAGDVAPAIGTTTANQLARLRGNTSGLLGAQSTAGSGWSWWASRKTPMLKPSTTYTLSIHGAPGGAYFYTNGYLQFFNADGSLHSYITTGFTVTPAAAPRQITFTTPAAAVSIAPNMRNTVDFTSTTPITAAHADLVAGAAMLNEGATAIDFAAWSGGAYVATANDFDPVSSGGQIIVARQGTEVYIRAGAQQSATYDVVWRLDVGRELDRSRIIQPQVVDFRGIRFIDKTAPSSSTISAFNQSALVHAGGLDETCPVRLNGMYLAGSHGVIGYRLTAAAHGKANVDVGSIWSDGTNQWVLMLIDTTGTLSFVRRYTGSQDKWSIATSAPASLNFTHVSGATNTGAITATVSAQVQFHPIIADYLVDVRLDDVAITADGVYAGGRLVIGETYALINAAAQQDALIAAVGAAVPDYTSAKQQIRFAHVYEWNKWGAMSASSGHGVKDAYRRSVATDYWGGIQVQRISLPADTTPGMQSTVWLYVPSVAPVAGYDFQAIANITLNAAEIRIPKASCAVPADPASHFAMIGKDGGGVVVGGHLFGYCRDVGLGVPDTRAAKVTDVAFFSTAEKQYPIAIDAAAGDAAVGNNDLVTAFRAPFLPTDTDLSIPAVIVTMDGKDYAYITAHQTLADKLVQIPSALNGRTVEVISTGGSITVNSTVVALDHISINVTGYGDAVLRLTP